MSRKQLEDMFALPPAPTPKPTPRPTPTPKLRLTSKPTPRPTPRPPTFTYFNDFENSEMTKKKRSLAKKPLYNWYDSLINHFSESVKKSSSGVKKVMKDFETKIDENVDHNIRKGYKAEKVADEFDNKYIENKSEGDEKLSIGQYINTRPYLHDMIDLENRKFIGQRKLFSCRQRTIMKNVLYISRLITE